MRTVLAVLSLVLTALAGPALAQSYGVTGDGTRSFVWDNGDVFTGAFRNGLPNGPGTFRKANGEVHSGDWQNGCLVSDRGYRVAVFTRLKDCPPRPPLRHPPLPRPDFR